jgi:hypothetical protein
VSVAQVYPISPNTLAGFVPPDAEFPGFQVLRAGDPGFDVPENKTCCQFCDRILDPESEALVETKQPMEHAPGQHWLSYFCSDECHAKACVLLLRIFDRNGNPTATIRFAREPQQPEALYLSFPLAQKLIHFATICGSQVQVFDHTHRRVYLAKDKRILEPRDLERFWREVGR